MLVTESRSVYSKPVSFVFDFHECEREYVVAEEVVSVSSQVAVVDLVAQVIAHSENAAGERLRFSAVLQREL